MNNDLLPFDIRLKYEIAEELGLLDKLKKAGWKGLSACETGKIGGIMKKRLDEFKKGESKKSKPGT